MMGSFACGRLLWIAAILGVLQQGWRLEANELPNSFFNGTNNGAYIDWLNTIGGSYTNVLYLPSNEPEYGSAIHWTIEAATSASAYIRLAVAVRATGWAGFGLSENGGMRGADFVLFTAANNTLTDAHALDELLPVEDYCNNWNLINSQTSGGFIIFEASRLLETNDTQDRAIFADNSSEIPPTRIIAAWGETPSVTYHGPDNRVRGSVRLFGNGEDEQSLFDAVMQAQSEGSFEIRASNYQIRAIDTEYAQFCFSAQEVIAMKVPLALGLHTIGFEPIIDPRGVKYVHHMVLQASFASNNNVGICNRARYPEFAFVWAPGEGPLAFPDFLGGPLGQNGFRSFNLEIHYNNPSFDTGVFDSSGLRLYFTTQKRQYDMGILQLGDPLVELDGISVGNGLVENTFTCPGSCVSSVTDEDLTVVREYLHMHQGGIKMDNKQIRNGQVIRTGAADYFDFFQQGTFAVTQPPFTIMPGDSFETSCYYNAGNELLEFGLSSQDEMCIAYLLYYPRKIQPGGFPFACTTGALGGPCVSQWEQTELASKRELGRTFGFATEVCEAPPAPTSTPASDAPTTISVSPPITPAPTSAPSQPASVAVDSRIDGLVFVLASLIYSLLLL